MFKLVVLLTHGVCGVVSRVWIIGVWVILIEWCGV